MQAGGHDPFLCFILVFLGFHINFTRYGVCVIQQFSFPGLYLNTVDISVSQPSKVLEIQQLSNSLL